MWRVYLLRCRGGALYCGITSDLERRLAEHRAGGDRSSRYVRGRLPFELVWQEVAVDKGAALRREAAIKAMSRAQKEGLVAGGH